MGQISSLFVRKVTNASRGDFDKKEILRSLDINPEDEVDPKQMVSDEDYYDFFERISRLDEHGHSLPLRAGAAMQCEDYGAFGLAWKSAANLLGSFQRASRYALVLTSVSSYEVRKDKGGALMLLHRDGERRLGMRLSNEATLASIYSISQEVSRTEFKADAAYFKHAAPSDVSAHSEYFGCPLYFDSDKDAILVSDEVLNEPNKLADQSFLEFFESHLENEIEDLVYEESFEEKVTRRISRRLSEGVPMVSEIASDFGMSERTLQRRLVDNNNTFRSLVDLARKQLATRLLKEPKYSLAEIAFMTGFSEQSAFNRAFKRWSGETPRTFRLKSVNL